MFSGGRLFKIIRKPVTDLIDENTDFIPDKVLADPAGVSMFFHSVRMKAHTPLIKKATFSDSSVQIK